MTGQERPIEKATIESEIFESHPQIGYGDESGGVGAKWHNSTPGISVKPYSHGMCDTINPQKVLVCVNADQREKKSAREV